MKSIKMKETEIIFFIVMQILIGIVFRIFVPEEHLVYRKRTINLFRSVGTIGGFLIEYYHKIFPSKYRPHNLA